MTRTTPRRTPSPHLRIDTQLDDGSSYPSSRRHSGSNLSNNTNVGSSYMHPALRPSTSNQQPPTERAHPYQSHHRDRSGSGSGTSSDIRTNTNANALSYASLPGPGPHRHSPSTSNVPTNENNHLANTADSSSSRRRSGSDTRPLPHHPTGLAPGTLELRNQKSETSIGDYSILRAPQGDRRRLSSSGDTSRSSEFDPYKAQGLPRPYSYHTHQRSASSTSLLRVPGEAIGADGSGLHHTRGWSLDDDTDRASLLMNREPMGVDDGMGFGGGGSVYLATPRDVNMGRHSRTQSSESFMTANSDFGTAERIRGGGPGGSARGGGWEGGDTGGRSSPTLSMLEADPRNRPGAFASYAGRESVSGSSGWDASTQAHGANTSPIDLPPVPALRDPDFSPRSNANFSSSPSLTPNRNLTPNVSPRMGHVRLGSTEVLKPSRSREDILVPARNDPVRLFPDSVRAAGYTTGLGPDAVPVPSRTPRPNGNDNDDGNGSGRTTGNSIERSVSSGVGLTGSGVFAGYVGRDSTQVGGGTWGTDSSGVQTIFEAVQQLPDVYVPPHAGPSSSRRTPS